jgi:hypothetical protein
MPGAPPQRPLAPFHILKIYGINGFNALMPWEIYFNVTEIVSMVYWSEFLASDPEVPGSIPSVTRFSET